MPRVRKGIHPELKAALEAGRLDVAQLPDSKTGQAEGYAYFDFLGGAFDGVRLRLYVPFPDELRLNGCLYRLSPPKDGRSKRLTYRTEDYEPRTQPRRKASRRGDPASAA